LGRIWDVPATSVAHAAPATRARRATHAVFIGLCELQAQGEATKRTQRWGEVSVILSANSRCKVKCGFCTARQRSMHKKKTSHIEKLSINLDIKTQSSIRTSRPSDVYIRLAPQLEGLVGLERRRLDRPAGRLCSQTGDWTESVDWAGKQAA